VADLPVGLEDVRRAARRVAGLVRQTPVFTSRALDERTGCRVFLKCENLQRVGAFKMRGASNLMLQLDADERRRGVVTHSSGNHAQAVALAARELGIRATIVMPENAPRVKREATAGYGATIVPCAPTQTAREEAVERVIRETGAVLVHPYDDARIVAGQGTAALELLDAAPDLDVLLAPVGGGGLLSGTALAALSRPGLRVVGCEPEGADDARRSLETGVRVTEQTPRTICDGLRTVLGVLPFRILAALGVPVAVASDDEVREALLLLLERTKLVVEPSAAVPVAALLQGRVGAAPGARVGVILSGGNVDLRAFVAGLR
jgi:threonine dehydratase/serine racemase